MADSLKTRVGRIIAGSVHALVDHLENHAPLAVMEQSLREADTVIGEVRHELGRTSANRHLAQQQHAHLNGQHATLAEQIDQALAADRDDLARAAVARQLDIEAQIPVLETTLADLARQESELTGYVAALLAKQREMADALEAFRQSRATATQAPATPPGGANAVQQRIDAVTGAFDRLYARQTGLAGTDRSHTLDQAAKLKELDELVRDHKIAERMARLKTGQA
ncbi:phage shock protein A [Acidovorax soli]|uniref:Phage shock protein A n=1 Tax=Acidovorax soli TaxID=592050 RepID=A0A7X0PAB5_9BURK|nr:PspA/IM30 family protein [Acidovorax soli]MBB6558176.1 phage shock protein A [Acidovorax soli]